VELGGREWGFSMRRGSPLWIFRGCCWSGVEGRKRGICCWSGAEGRERGRGISAAEGREMVEGGGVGGGGVGVVVE
jgi:hypothetical protein